ncbi:hypothetical protein AAF712_009224 [Marasmius tenuissimus]|uniref:Uncharacterized protein n=1 Tax=Marasmius tenuissimus TaxID=585030 RepID=A0ABR2ZQC5_9AGAR
MDLRISEVDVLEDILSDKLVKTVTKLFVEKLIVGNREADTPETSIPSPFLPKLKLLKLVVHAHFDADMEFVRMVKSRWYPIYAGSAGLSPSGCRSLRSATLDIQGRKVERSIYKPLEICDRKGMRIVVKASGEYIV